MGKIEGAFAQINQYLGRVEMELIEFWRHMIGELA